MTMASMTRHIFIFLVSISVAVDGAIDLKEACATTPYPDICLTVLSANPKSKTADARGLALIAIHAADKIAANANAAVDVQLEANSDEVTRMTARLANVSDTPTSLAHHCFEECLSIIQTAREKFYGTDDESTFSSARYFFQVETARRSWDPQCDRCHVDGTPKLPSIISKGGDFDKFMQVTSKLVMEAPGGIIPPPPPDEFANGTV